MRRRGSPEDEEPTPLRLRRFDAADWPHGCHPECAYYDALERWIESGGDLPDDWTGPDAPWHPELI